MIQVELSILLDKMELFLLQWRQYVQCVVNLLHIFRGHAAGERRQRPMLDIGLYGLYVKSNFLQHSPPFARPIFTDVGFVVIRIEKIHTWIEEIIFGDAPIVDDKHPSMAKHTLHFGKRQSDVGEMMRGSAARYQVEAIILKRKPMHVSDLKGDIVQRLFPSKSFSFIKHGPSDIDAYYRIHMRRESECGVAGSRRNVEHIPVRSRLCKKDNALENLWICMRRTG